MLTTGCLIATALFPIVYYKTLEKIVVKIITCESKLPSGNAFLSNLYSDFVFPPITCDSKATVKARVEVLKISRTFL